MKRPLLWLTSLTLALGILAAAGGCALTKQRAEALYMRQQGAQSDLADTLATFETARPALAERLYRLEDELHSACWSLREAGLRRFEGETLGSRLELAIMTSLDRCETTTGAVEREVQQALASEGDEIAKLAPALGHFSGQ